MNKLVESSIEANNVEAILERDFFESVPPGQWKEINALNLTASPANNTFRWDPVDILLHCASEECSGPRYFEPVGPYNLHRHRIAQLFVNYRCRNCGESVKEYSISVRASNSRYEMMKYGELPQFGAPTPAKVLSLMGSEREIFLKGRRCENQGLGVGAFAYYRRVVENQKAKIISEILKVAEQLEADPALIDDLKAAKNETRFTEAINRVKHGLPQVLLINGHNPLTLLHSALSEGLHATSDDECLELATSIRVVLTELVERMADAVKEEAELTSAVQRLLKANAKR